MSWNPVATKRVALDVEAVRPAAGAMIVAAAVLPVLPRHVGLPCPLRSITGIPCPLCGMTTGVTAAAHLHLKTAIAANPLAVPLVMAALILLARPRLVPKTLPTWLVVLAASGSWAWELVRFGVPHRLLG